MSSVDDGLRTLGNDLSCVDTVLISVHNDPMKIYAVNYVLVFLLSFAALKSEATDLVGAISGGMGGTGRAAVETNESLFLNPAAIALFDKFYTGFSYQSGFTDTNISRNIWGITMTDGTPGIMFPGAFSYRRHHINDQGRVTRENEFKAGMGFRWHSRVSLGLGVSHLRAVAYDGEKITQNNVDFGFLFGLRPNWGLSLSGENLIEAKDDVPQALLRPSRAALGTQYVMDRRVTFRYEALMPLYTENDSLLAHRAGLSIATRGHFFLNGGYSVDDNRQENWSSVGFTWKGPRLKLAYSVQTESRSGLGTRHFVDLWTDI